MQNTDTQMHTTVTVSSFVFPLDHRLRKLLATNIAEVEQFLTSAAVSASAFAFAFVSPCVCGRTRTTYICLLLSGCMPVK